MKHEVNTDAPLSRQFFAGQASAFQRVLWTLEQDDPAPDAEERGWFGCNP